MQMVHMNLGLYFGFKIYPNSIKLNSIIFVVDSFEGADGSSRQEKGIVINPGTDNEAVIVEGTYKYLDAENKPVQVHYTANEKGFLPDGGLIDPAISKAARLVSENVDVEEEKH